MAWSRHGKTQEFFDKFKAGLENTQAACICMSVGHHSPNGANHRRTCYETPVKVTFFPPKNLGEGKWGRKQCRRIPKREGDWQGRVPKRSLHPKTLQNKRFGAPNFLGISPKLFAALRGIHPYLCTPVLPRGQKIRQIWRLFFFGGQRATTNVQHRFVQFFLLSFLLFFLFELKPLVFKWTVLGEKFWKSAKKCEKALYQKGKSAMNLSNLGNFAKIWPRAIYLC